MADETTNEPRIYYINRTTCDILKDMRNIIKVSVDLLNSVPVTDDDYVYLWNPTKQSFLVLAGQIEELQWAANRMEAGLQDKKDLLDLVKERSDLKAEVFALREEKKQLLIEKLQDSEEN